MGKEVVEAELYEPRFFIRKRIFNKETNDWMYEYDSNGQYWLQRERGEWHNSPDICSDELVEI